MILGWLDVKIIKQIGALVLDVNILAAGDYDPAWGAWDEEEEQYNPDKYGIKLISHPMNYTDTQFDKELL